MTEKQILQQSMALDDEYRPIIQAYLKGDEGRKALALAKSCLRSLESAR